MHMLLQKLPLYQSYCVLYKHVYHPNQHVLIHQTRGYMCFEMWYRHRVSHLRKILKYTYLNVFNLTPVLLLSISKQCDHISSLYFASYIYDHNLYNTNVRVLYYISKPKRINETTDHGLMFINSCLEIKNEVTITQAQSSRH